MGMPKCGTTDLYAKIVRHDSVVNLLKEPHWWARKRVGRGKRDFYGSGSDGVGGCSDGGGGGDCDVGNGIGSDDCGRGGKEGNVCGVGVVGVLLLVMVMIVMVVA